MAVKNFDKALKYTNSQVKKLETSRAELHDFWLNQTPGGQAIRDGGTYGDDVTHAETDDDFFINVIITGIQEFVYGDEGDAVMGVPQQPAKPSEVDGKFGPMTNTRRLTWLEFVNDDIDEDVLIDQVPEMSSSDFIVFGGQRIEVPGVEIVSFDEPGGLDLVPALKKKWKRRKGYNAWPKSILDLDKKKYPQLLGFVHWDAGWSAGGAYKALIRRGLGSTCGIDRPRKADGKVIAYQWMDPGKYYGVHGGSANKRSLFSFDLSCAVYAKYAAKYKKLCGIDRPLLKISSRETIGKGNAFLGMYRDQILTMMRILKALSKHTGLPYHWPLKPDGSFQGRNYKRLWKDDFRGVAEHRHLPSTTKWDCRGLFAQTCVLLLTDPALMAEFPEFVAAHDLQNDKWAKWLAKCEKHWQWTEVWG